MVAYPNMPARSDRRAHRSAWAFAQHLERVRRLEPLRHVDDSQLANQLTVPRQYEPKPINDLLRHEVVAHIPAEFALDGGCDNRVKFKVHALRYLPMERCRCFSPPLPLAANCSAPRGLGAFALRSSLLGVWGESAARLERGWNAVGTQVSSHLHDPGAGVAICQGVFLDADFPPIEQPHHCGV